MKTTLIIVVAVLVAAAGIHEDRPREAAGRRSPAGTGEPLPE